MTTHDMIVQRVHTTHHLLLQTTSELAEEQFSRRLNQTAPPIGWHLWHVARFADILQATIIPDAAGQELWQAENLAQQWDLNPETLGVWETGLDMAADAAASIPVIVGQARLLDYARRAFTKVDEIAAGLDPARSDEPRQNSQTHGLVGGKLTRIVSPETTPGADLVFHIYHANRHLGMIEALRGLLEIRGTATL